MSSNRIHALPLHLANQIAAGEVIERPASVVKELVENSIDAGATQIDIDIEGAGSQLIRVRDNGVGIHPDDLLLALDRHATSKLHSSEQLSHIASLGFRGEALPSIASISRLTLTSHQQDNDCGWQLQGDNNELVPASHPKGTTLEVRDLFFNLPARRRFLRGNKTEQHHILTTLNRLALSQFDIAFQYKFSAKSSAKLPIATTTEQRQQRLAKICGKAFVTNSLFIDQHYDGIDLKGWLGTADAHRPQTDVQYFFINGRVIRDRVINHAIRQAYGDLIPAGRHSAYVLYLNLPLDRVDINVHPTKHEVRFRDARLIHGLISSALQEALSQQDNDIQIEPAPTDKTSTYSHDAIADKPLNYQYAKKPSSAENFNARHLSTTSRFGQPIALLQQRYLLTQSETGSLLLDLQQANQYQLQQQLKHAIETNTLRSRPILVPITIAADADLIHAAQQHSEILNTVGIQLKAQSDSLIIKSIPSLLAQTDIKQIIILLLSEMAHKQVNIEQLSTLLQQNIPLITISHLEQAKQVLNQLDDSSINTNWCIQLDQQTLSSLFYS